MNFVRGFRRKSAPWPLRFFCVFTLIFVLASLAAAQQTGRSGGRRRNYPLGGLGFPMPELPAVNYRGKLEKLDDKIILVELTNGQFFTFQRSGKTKFYKNSKQIKASDLKIGDPVSVDATEDPQAYLDAVDVSFDDSPPPPEEAAASPDAPGSAASPQAPPQSIQYDERGRPTLRRRPAPPAGIGPDQNGGEAPPANPAGANGAGESPPPTSFPSAQPRSGAADDAVLAKARALANNLPGKLPSFICQEVMSRYTRSNGGGWEPLDVVSADVVYDDGAERHTNVKLNNRPADPQQLSGSWPVERLVSAVSDLFAPAAAAKFQFGGESNLVDLKARDYDFDVSAATSRWAMRMGTQSINAAYTGSVWIETGSGRVLRLEMQAKDLPAAFPLDQVETDVEYSSVRLGGEQAILPAHVETVGCQRDTHACSRSVIDFRNYQPVNAAPPSGRP